MVSRRSKGIALITTLIIITLLVVIVVQYVYSTSTDLIIGKNYESQLKMDAAIDGAMQYITFMMTFDKVKGDEDSYHDIWATMNKDMAFGDVDVHFEIIDQSRYFDVNNLVASKGELNSFAAKDLDRLARLAGLSSDVTQRVQGLLQDTFKEYPPNVVVYKPVTFPIFAGDTARLLFGSQTYQERDELIFVRHLTFWSDRQVNVNTASSIVLEALGGDFSSDTVRLILKHREEEAFKSISDLETLEGVNEDIINSLRSKVDFSSEYFMIDLTASMGKFTKKAHYLIRRLGDGKCVVVFYNDNKTRI